MADADLETATEPTGPRVLAVVYLKGIAMGCADAVPGVSGGTIALITGIYERLIGAVTAVNVDRIVEILGFPLPDKRGEAVGAFFELDGPFLVVLLAGIVTAVVTVTRVVDVMIETRPVATFGFFFGLIAASALVLYDQVSFDTPGRIAAGVLGFALAFVTSGSASAAFGEGGAVVTVVAGAIAVSAMILPGISGSLLLILLGQYEFMIGTLSAFIDRALAVLSGGDPAAVVAPGTTVVLFVSGALVGLFTIAHLVRWALERYREATLAFLVSLIVGALRSPVVNVNAEIAGPWTTGVLWTFVATAVVGAALVVGLDRTAGLGE